MFFSLIRSTFTFTGIKYLTLFILLIVIIVTALLTLPLEKILKNFVLWLKKDVGPWGPVILAVAYIPLSILAVPGSILTLGGGYVFGLFVGFIADSIGSTLGATAAFIVGKTIGRSYVTAKLKDYPQFQTLSSIIAKSGFKIILLLRLVPIVPFNIMNYLLAVTPISVSSFMLASWLGTMPSTFAFVYIGTTLKDISEIGNSTAPITTVQWWMMGLGFVTTVVVIILITRIAKDALQKAIEEHELNGKEHNEGKHDHLLSSNQILLSSQQIISLGRSSVSNSNSSEGTSEKRPLSLRNDSANQLVDQI